LTTTPGTQELLRIHEAVKLVNELGNFTGVLDAVRRLVKIKVMPINDGHVRCQDCERMFGQVISHNDAQGYACPIMKLSQAIDIYDDWVAKMTIPTDLADEPKTFIADCAWCEGKDLLTFVTGDMYGVITGPCPTSDCEATLNLLLEAPEPVSA